MYRVTAITDLRENCVRPFQSGSRKLAFEFFEAAWKQTDIIAVFIHRKIGKQWVILNGRCMMELAKEE